MKKVLITTFILLLLPSLSLAHGGVSKNAGTTVVYLNQSPISPLVGENVAMNFVIRDQNNKAVANLPVTLRLVDTFYGDETKDKLVLTKNLTTDANGSFDFNYTFNKENYFDIELQFQDPQSHAPLDTGFLVQPRKSKSSVFELYELLIASGAGLIAGFLLARVKFKQPKT